jgi:pSer/pThr/pTyr-binding forkhead associated (FHA) protein
MAVKLVVRHAKSAGAGQGEISFEFEQARLTIGRSSGADVRLPGLTVSELHATLEQQEGQAKLRDEGSTNGTRVNGVPLVPSRSRTLVAGDEIEVGEFTLVFTGGPLLGVATSPERTASLARRLLRELAEPDQDPLPSPCLRVVEGPDQGTVINLEEPPARLVIGRGDTAQLALSDADVSREHAEVARDLDGSVVRDLASKNGLDINGKRLRERRLRHGDVLRLGGTAIVYEDPAERALKGLEGQPDMPLTRTRPLAVESHAEPEAPPPAPVPPPVQPAPRGPQKADLVVYGLAGFVLLASLLGLAWLFH